MASKEMRYGMLGDDNASMEEKLAKYSGKVGWDYLKEHFQNGVLFFVDEGLTLEEVGAAISDCLLYTSPSPRDRQKSRMPSSA